VAGVVNTVVELQVPSDCGSVLTSLGTVGLTRRTVLRIVSALVC
jgi:hypothetical protein